MSQRLDDTWHFPLFYQSYALSQSHQLEKGMESVKCQHDFDPSQNRQMGPIRKLQSCNCAQQAVHCNGSE